MCFTPAELVLGMLAACAIGIVTGAVIENRLRLKEDLKAHHNTGDPRS